MMSDLESTPCLEKKSSRLEKKAVFVNQCNLFCRSNFDGVVSALVLYCPRNFIFLFCFFYLERSITPWNFLLNSTLRNQFFCFVSDWFL